MKRAYLHLAARMVTITPVVVALFAGLLTHAGAIQVREEALSGATRPALARWHSVGGAWRNAREALTGVVDGTTRGFAVADDARAAGPQIIEAEITPMQRVGDSWSAGGLCLYAYSGGYWRLALAESQDRKTRYAELTLQDEGVGVGNSALKVLTKSELPFAWKWNTAYRLRLGLAADKITGEIFSIDGVRHWSVSYSLTGSAFVRFGWPAVGVQGMQGQFRHVTQTVAKQGEPGSESIRCADLEEKQSRSLWLSLPKSRLVINPNMPASAPAPVQVAPWLPLNAAYYSGDRPVRLPFLWGWRCDAANSGSRPTVTIGPSADFSPSAERNWQAYKLSVEYRGASVKLTPLQPPFGSLSTMVTVDLDQTPFMTANVDSINGHWALKVNAGSQPVDTYVQHDTRDSGSFLYDLSAITGWHGKHTFKLILFAIGEKHSTATFSGLRFAGVKGEFAAPAIKETDWYPQKIVQRSADPAGAINVESTVCLPGENTVAQRLMIRSAPTSIFTLTGQLPAGETEWDDEHHALIYQGEGFQEVMVVSRAAHWLGEFDSFLDQAAGRPPRAVSAEGGAWAIGIDGVRAGDQIVVTARFGRPGEAVDTLLMEAETPASTAGFQAALEGREAAWNALLSKVPDPSGFALHSLNTHGVTADAIRRTYFKAWIFLLSDIIPPLPETGFDFPQVACGKPSLWDEGAKGSEATSQWESFIGIQYLAFVDPLAAWDAYTGEMTLVAEDGSLGGEGLPSRHAQTAWVLNSLTKDVHRLRAVYPNLKRLLEWKAAHPRWIYHNATPEDQKDSEFVVHALMDMEYTKRIAHALDMPAEEQYWDVSSAQLTANYHRWFWDESGRSYRLYRTSTGKSESPELSWNLEGLTLPPDILRQNERDNLLRLFHTSVHADIPFFILALSAFPKYNFTVRGVWQYGTVDEAALLIDSAMRDTTLAGEFSESYTQAFPPAPLGVTPSMFGVAQIIDNVLWHNGLMLGDGLPVLVRIPHARGVSNLRLNGKAMDVLVDEGADLIVLQGDALSSLIMPVGFHSSVLPDGTMRWDTKLSAAPQTLALIPDP